MLGNKNRIPFIMLPNESDILSEMRLIQTLNQIEHNIVIIPIENENVEPIIATVGHGKLNTSFALAALALTQIASSNKSNHTTIIDDRNYSEKDGNLMRIYSSEYFGEKDNLAKTYLDDSDYTSPKMSLQKKDRKHNNRKTKKRKKAKNGK